MAKNFLSALLLIVLLFLPQRGVPGSDSPQLRINCTFHGAYEAFFFRLVEEICARNRIAVAHNTPPAERSLINVNQGIDDGDGPRIGGLSAVYPNLVFVPEPFGEFVFGAFARDPNTRIDGWASLADLNVAYVHGWKIFDDHVKEAKSITRVKNLDLLFGLLNAGRTDAVLATKMAGYATIGKLGLQGIRFVESPLAVKPTFLYLHQRHADLAVTLGNTLKAIKADGTYQRLYEEIVAPTLPQ